MNIREKTECGNNILSAESEVESLKRLIDFIIDSDTDAKTKGYRAVLEIEKTKNCRSGPQGFYTITEGEIINIINRTLEQKQEKLNRLIEQYNLIN